MHGRRCLTPLSPHRYDLTVINQHYQSTSSDLFSAVKSNLTAWCCQNLSSRALNRNVNETTSWRGRGQGISQTKTRMWADEQRDGRPAESTWRPLRQFSNFIPCTTPQSLADARPLARAPQCIHSVPAQEMARYRAKFGWPPVSDVSAVTLPRREPRWNLLECPKLPKRSQPLVSRSWPHCEDMWRRYCCLTCFSNFRFMPYFRKYCPTKLCDGAQVAIFLRHFCVLYFQRAACSTLHTCILNSH